MSSPASHDEESKGYTPHMRGVALGILVMGISLAAVIATLGNNWIPRSRFFNTGHGKTARMAT